MIRVGMEFVIQNRFTSRFDLSRKSSVIHDHGLENFHGRNRDSTIFGDHFSFTHFPVRFTDFHEC